MDWKNFVSPLPQDRRTGSIGCHIARELKAMEYGKNKSRTLARIGREA